MPTLSHHSKVPHRRSARGRYVDDAGVILPIVAISMVSFLLLAGLVIDGSHAYPQRRNMQNSADAAALAATRALDMARTSGTDFADVETTAQSVAADNGADSVTCEIINPHGQPLGPCNNSSALQSPNAAGVKVGTADDRPTTFPGIGGQDSVTARAQASATIQSFSGGAGTPFVVCGNPAMGGYPILGADGRIDPVAATAMGRVPIQGSQVPRCGAGAAFKGKIDETAVIDQLPATVRGDNGNGYDGGIAVQVLGASACTEADLATMAADGAVACDMILPVSDLGWGNGNSIGQRAVAWAVFHVTGNGSGNPKYYGEFVGTNSYISSGRTTTTIPGPGQPRTVRLIS